MAFDAFLKLGGIAGGETDAKHKGEIRVQAYSFGVENTGSVGSASGGAGAGKATFTDFVFTTALSVASPQLLQACASGKHFPDALLTLRRSGGGKGPVDFCRVTLKEVLISSYQDSASSADDTPIESVSLIFGAMKVEFIAQAASGAPGQTTSGGWDRVKNQPFNG